MAAERGHTHALRFRTPPGKRKHEELLGTELRAKHRETITQIAVMFEEKLRSNLHPEHGNNLGTERAEHGAKRGSGPTRRQDETTT
jgi:hypothetical protein